MEQIDPHVEHLACDRHAERQREDRQHRVGRARGPQTDGDRRCEEPQERDERRRPVLRPDEQVLVVDGRRPGQRIKADRYACKVLKLVGEGQSYREISHRLGLSKNTVLDIVKRDRAAKMPLNP